MLNKFVMNDKEYSSENWKPISSLPMGEEVIVYGKFQHQLFIAQVIIHENGCREVITASGVASGTRKKVDSEWDDAIKFGELVYWQPAVSSQCEVVDEVIKTIKNSIMEFSCRVGMHPNCLLLSEDVLGCLVNCFENTEVIFLDKAGKDESLEGSTMVKVMGLPVRVVVGEGTVVPAIL